MATTPPPKPGQPGGGPSAGGRPTRTPGQPSGGGGLDNSSSHSKREGLRVRLQPIPGITDTNLMPIDGFYFQCPPLEEFDREYAFAHTDYDTAKLGQFSRKGGKQLTTVQFDTLFVDQGNYAVLTQDIKIEVQADRLIKICESGSPFLLTVAHQMPPHGYDNWGDTLAGPELQMEATLRTITVSEKAGEGDARYVNVAFTEYREPFVDRSTSVGRRRKPDHYPKTVLLFRDGSARDKATNTLIGHPPQNPLTLARLAKVFYHRHSLWKHIAGYKRNNIKNWGASDQLLDYFVNVKHVRHWPVKISIPAPPRSGQQTPDSHIGGGVATPGANA